MNEQIDPALLAALSNAARHPRTENLAIVALQLIAERVEAIWPTDGPEVGHWIRTVADALLANAVHAAEQGPAPGQELPAITATAAADDGQHPELEVPAKGRRARTVKGQYRGDDPATPDVNEAYIDPDSTTTD